MPTAVDTSVLIAAERGGNFFDFIAAIPGEFYIPAHAAAEFLAGTHPPTKEHLREPARRIYENLFREIVEPFEESDAAQLAALNAELRRAGNSMMRRLPPRRWLVVIHCLPSIVTLTGWPTG